MKRAVPPSAWMPLAAFGAVMLLHVDNAPPWSIAVALAGMGWQFLHLRGRLALPGAMGRGAIALALLAATATSFRSITGLAAGTNLLLVMGAAKLLEIRQPRDARVIALVSLALLMAAVLERQTLPRVPLYLASAWISLACLAALGEGRAAGSGRAALKIAGRTLFYAMPLAALCFLLVPRLPGALWSMQADDSAVTGLSEEMSPGSISQISASDDVAFRVRFEDAAPPLSQRYWRGPVLHDFDGQTWRRVRNQIARKPLTEPASDPVRYRILQEPTGRSFLFGLDTIGAITTATGRPVLQLFDGQVVATRPVTSTLAYNGVSYPQVRSTADLSALGRRIDTQLPGERNPRARALARELRSASRDDADYVQRVLAHFRDTGLEYTLSPPTLGADSVDDLLFRTRLGFCGHFASAYVTLMRAAGVPSRVVTGYLGGAWNAVGGYYAVRQSDAHAWAEVWLEGRGGVRVDPTAVVAPERLRRTLDDLLGQRASFSDRMFVRAPWLSGLRDSWDAAANWWQERVVNYNLAAQTALLRRLGLENIDYRLLALALLAGAALWGAWVSLQLHQRANVVAPDALSRLWRRYANLLARRGVPVAAHDAPATVAQRAAHRHPAAASEIQRFSDQYLHLRFGIEGAASAAELRELRERLRALERAAHH